jgi:hypothetical protein
MEEARKIRSAFRDDSSIFEKPAEKNLVLFLPWSLALRRSFFPSGKKHPSGQFPAGKKKHPFSTL